MVDYIDRESRELFYDDESLHCLRTSDTIQPGSIT